MESEEIVLTLAAIFISIIALIYSIREGKISQKHNRLSVRPILGFSLYASAAYKRFSLILENNGLGPALIKSYIFLVDEKSFEELRKSAKIEKWEELSVLLGYPQKLDWHYINKNSILKVGDNIEIVGFNCDNYSAELASKFRQAVRRLIIEVEYSSLYEIENFKECFTGNEDIVKE